MQLSKNEKAKFEEAHDLIYKELLDIFDEKRGVRIANYVLFNASEGNLDEVGEMIDALQDAFGKTVDPECPFGED